MDLSTTPLAQWSGVEGRPVVIAGPCSAESREQVDETARRLAGLRVDYLRAGIWKPRTRPGSFEGIGESALPWLAEAGRRHGLRTATEVASAAHVEAALAHGIDLLWIGARTTASPFAVQEIANALRGAAVPVLVKNPTSPELALWFGALERVHSAGVRSLGAIHRGFTTANSGRFRNAPMWEIAIEFRRALPGVPLLSDPSHIAGRRELIADLAQAAMDLGLDGLMIEAHPNPDQAWSDAAQQVTPERLGEVLARLRVRRATSSEPGFNAGLQALRDRIDQVDQAVLDLLSQRMRLVEEIAEAKRAGNIASLQVTRWRALLEQRLELAGRLGLPPEYARAVFEVIHAESVRRQSELMGNGPDPAPPA